MKVKSKVGSYFLYRYNDEYVIGRIIKDVSTFGKNFKGERLFTFKIIKSSNIRKLGISLIDARFSDGSDVYAGCIMGKSLDELWVRMI